MSGFNPNISDGVCYFNNSGVEAPSRYIPCGNSAGGHVTCCQSQDNCLSSRACYNPQHGVTYLAGCTDSLYKADVCPNKGQFSDQAWVGLVYCNGTSNQWTGCHESQDAATVSVPEPCWCPKTSRAVLFEDASVLANTMFLPASTGQSVTWGGGFGPFAQATSSVQTTSSASSSTTAISNPSSDTRTSPPAITSPPPINTTATFPSSSPPSSLNTGAKVGIGLGAGVGALILLVFVILLTRRCYSKKSASQKGGQGQDDVPSQTRQSQISTNENGEARSPAWSGYKSELPGHESKQTLSPTNADFVSNTSEVEGSPAIGGDGRLVKSGGYEMPGRPGTIYEMPG